MNLIFKTRTRAHRAAHAKALIHFLLRNIDASVKNRACATIVLLHTDTRFYAHGRLLKKTKAKKVLSELYIRARPFS